MAPKSPYGPEPPLARPYVDAARLVQPAAGRPPRPGYQNPPRNQPVRQPQLRSGQPPLRPGQAPPNPQRTGRPGWAPVDPSGPYPNGGRSGPVQPGGPPANGPRIEPPPSGDSGSDPGRPRRRNQIADGRQPQDAGKRARRRRPGH